MSAGFWVKLTRTNVWGGLCLGVVCISDDIPERGISLTGKSGECFQPGD